MSNCNIISTSLIVKFSIHKIFIAFEGMCGLGFTRIPNCNLNQLLLAKRLQEQNYKYLFKHITADFKYFNMFALI